MHRGMVIFARQASREVRHDAREMYINLVARIGVVPYSQGLTWRRALARPNEASRWWYHPVSYKDCESDPTFNSIIAVLTICSVAKKQGLKKLVLVGAPWEIAAVLKSGFVVEEKNAHCPSGPWRIYLRGVASRVLLVLRLLRQWFAICRQLELPKNSFAVVFSGFWDWSVVWDDQTKSLVDRYFKALPEELRRQGVPSIGWFTWFDPHSEPGRKHRRYKEVLSPLKGRDDVVILQRFLYPKDIIKATVDMRPLVTYLRIRRKPAFREAFRVGHLNYDHLFSERLLQGFLNASIAQFELVTLATERASKWYRPRISVSFLEHFPYSRAYYEGLRRAKTGTMSCAVQHASYSHEKTFLFFHPSLEFRGEPDGCVPPHPDYVFAMGTLGRDLFLECGYPKGCVLLTGSPRYDHVRLSSTPLPLLQQRAKGEGRCIRILVVSSLDVEVEVDMVEAVATAVRDMDGVKLFLRNHPFSRVEQHPRFAAYKDQIELAHGSLQENLEHADLILFTYSTAAEEAFLQGKPVWQWLPLQFNGSALSEAAAIPQFGSVAKLRDALREFSKNPVQYFPSLEMRQYALERLFYRGDGCAAKRISEILKKRLLSYGDHARCRAAL